MSKTALLNLEYCTFRKINNIPLASYPVLDRITYHVQIKQLEFKHCWLFCAKRYGFSEVGGHLRTP